MGLGCGECWCDGTGREAVVELLLEDLELTFFELGHLDFAPVLGSADESRIHQFQHGALAEGMRDHLGAPPLFAEQALEEIRNRYEDHGARSSGWDSFVLAYGVTIRDEGHREHVSGQADPER